MTTGVLIVPEPRCRRIIKASRTPKSSGIEIFTGPAFHTRLVRCTLACDGPREPPMTASEDLPKKADLTAEKFFRVFNRLADESAQFRYSLHNLSTPHIQKMCSSILQTNFRGKFCNDSDARMLQKFVCEITVLSPAAFSNSVLSLKSSRRDNNRFNLIKQPIPFAFLILLSLMFIPCGRLECQDCY